MAATRFEELQQASVRVFAESGFAATGIREIGGEAGLNSATLYHYVTGKEDLLAIVMRTCLDELQRAAADAIVSSPDPRVQLGRIVAVHVGVCAADPLTATVTDYEVRALSAAHRSAVVDLRDGYEALVQRVIARGVRSGQFDVPDARLARLALLEMCNGVAHWYRPDGRLSVPAVQRGLVEMACRLVGTAGLTRAELAGLPTPVRLPCEPPTRSVRRLQEVPA